MKGRVESGGGDGSGARLRLVGVNGLSGSTAGFTSGVSALVEVGVLGYVAMVDSLWRLWCARE